MENSERDGNTRPPDLPLEKPVCRFLSQEATVRTGHGTTDWFQIGKGVCQGCILSPCLFNLYADQETTDGTSCETRDWFKIGKGVHQGCILSPCSIN